MSKDDDRKRKLREMMMEDDIFHSSSSAARRSQDPSQKKIRRVQPLGMRVLVSIKPDSNQTETGLYLPEGAKTAMAESVLAEVIEVATASEDHVHDETNVSGIPLGAIILIPKEAGVRIPWNEKLRIVDSKDVLAIVAEISLS